MTDVRNFGFFVDVAELGLSGLVPLSSLDDDFYEFDAAEARVRGRRNRRVFKLGDRVEVEIAEVDTAMKRLDFRLAERPKEKPAKSAQRRRAKGKRAKSKPPKGSTTRLERSGRKKGRS